MELNRMRFELYTDVAGEFRWRFVANNNRIMADSGEGYDSREGCMKSLAKVRDYFARDIPIIPIAEVYP